MTASGASFEARRRRRARQLLVLQATPFDPSPDAVLQASASLDETELRAAWLLGRQRLSAVAEFESGHGSDSDPSGLVEDGDR